MKTSSDLYNDLPLGVRKITQTLMLYTEKNNLALVIEELRKSHQKEVKRIQDKIARIDTCINSNLAGLGVDK